MTGTQLYDAGRPNEGGWGCTNVRLNFYAQASDEIKHSFEIGKYPILPELLENGFQVRLIILKGLQKV